MAPPANESPSSLVLRGLSLLTESDREAFYSLSYINRSVEGIPTSADPNEVALSIFQTNGISAGTGVGLFPKTARLNHGCSSAFNVVYSWREREGILVTYALKPIKSGDVSNFDILRNNL